MAMLSVFYLSQSQLACLVILMGISLCIPIEIAYFGAHTKMIFDTSGTNCYYRK
jgi:hypothetical protein